MARLAGLLLALVGPFVGRVLIALGLSFTVFSGVDILFGIIRSEFLSRASGIPAVAIGFLGLLKVGTCFNILLSAISIRWVLSGLSGGSLRKLTQR